MDQLDAGDRGMNEALELTPILDGRVRCVQPAEGFRFSVDALLLARFALETADRGSFVELAAGCGVVSALLARAGMGEGVALELNPVLLRCARETMAANGLESRVRVELADLRTLKPLLAAGCASTVVANPPYFPAGTARVSEDAGNAGARHELTCTMEDVLSAGRYLLPEGGRLVLVYPAWRLDELMQRLPAFKLGAARLRLVHPREGKPASHLLLQAVKARVPRLVVEAPWLIHGVDGRYTGWYSELVTRMDEAPSQSPGPA